jgi:hypothetical protein
MIIASDNFKAAMKDPVNEVYAKVEFLDKNENVIEEITTKVIDGFINVSKEQLTRRMFSLSLLNDNNDFTWSVGGRVWLDKRIKLWTGLEITSTIVNKKNIQSQTDWEEGTISDVQITEEGIKLNYLTTLPGTITYMESGSWTSPIYSLQATKGFLEVTLQELDGTDVVTEYRISKDNKEWSSWTKIKDGHIYPAFNYIQVRYTLSTEDPSISPTVSRIKINGVSIIETVEYVPQGVYVLTELSAASSYTGDKVASLSGADKWHLLNGDPVGKFTNVTTIQAGTKISDAIKTVATDAGITKFLFDDCDVVVPYDLTYQPGDPRGKAIKELADLAVYSIFFDVNGYLRFRPQVDLETSSSVWTYDKSDYTLYARSEKRLDHHELFNKVLVIGGSSQTATVSAIAEDNDANSPTGIPTIGERLFLYNNGSPDPLISTQALAKARADYELKNRLRIAERQPLELLPNYLHEVEDVIQLVDDGNKTNDKYELISFNIPLKPGQKMTAEAWRIRKIG